MERGGREDVLVGFRDLIESLTALFSLAFFSVAFCLTEHKSELFLHLCWWLL